MKLFEMVICYMLFFCLTLTTGCSNHSISMPKEKPLSVVWTTDPSNPDSIKIQGQLDTNLTIDAKIKGPVDLKEADILRASLLVLNREVLESRLLQDSNITRKNESSTNLHYETADGKQLGISSHSLFFNTPHFNNIRAVFGIAYRIAHYEIGDNLDSYQQNRDLPFLPYAEVIERVKEEFGLLNISVQEPIELYALDYQTMREQEKIRLDSGLLTDPRDGSVNLKGAWTEEDNCYFLIMHLSLQNIPVFPSNHGKVEDKTLVYGSSLYACYSVQGLEYLTISAPYQQTGIAQENVPLISLEDALSVVQHKYSNVILTDPTAITEISFFYVPTLVNKSREEFFMRPAWCFQVGQEVVVGGTVETAIYYNTVIIDATSGQEIL